MKWIFERDGTYNNNFRPPRPHYMIYDEDSDPDNADVLCRGITSENDAKMIIAALNLYHETYKAEDPQSEGLTHVTRDPDGTPGLGD